MAKITSGQSKEIYELATAPDRKMSNVEIGKKFGISERSVRFHIKKWEKQVHTLAKTNGKVASALANHAVNVTTEATSILEAVKTSILEAKVAGVSPEKLAPLYSNWIKSLELASELLGDLSRAPQVNIQVNQQFNEFIKAIMEGEDDATKQRISAKLRKNAIY
jgi:DNA-binding Lrp family transcriptional regulator